MTLPRIPPNTAPPITFVLSAFGSELATLLFSSGPSVATLAGRSCGTPFSTTERTRNVMRELSGESPGVREVTSSTIVVPAGITAPLLPVTGVLTVATSLSPTWFDDVQTLEPVERPISVPGPKDFCGAAAGAGAGVGAGAETAAAVG